jgi:hypothetical protein
MLPPQRLHHGHLRPAHLHRGHLRPAHRLRAPLHRGPLPLLYLKAR